MKYENLKRVMEAVAVVAEAVGNLRALLPAGSDKLDDLAQNLCYVGDQVLEEAMLGADGDLKTEDRGQKTAKTADSLRSPAAAKKPRAVKTEKEPTIGPLTNAACAVDKPKKGYAVQGTCTICGKPFLKRSPIQKTCSPECAAEKNKAYARAKYAEGAATDGDRLTRIKDLADKMG